MSLIHTDRKYSKCVIFEYRKNCRDNIALEFDILKVSDSHSKIVNIHKIYLFKNTENLKSCLQKLPEGACFIENDTEIEIFDDCTIEDAINYNFRVYIPWIDTKRKIPVDSLVPDIEEQLDTKRQRLNSKATIRLNGHIGPVRGQRRTLYMEYNERSGPLLQIILEGVNIKQYKFYYAKAKLIGMLTSRNGLSSNTSSSGLSGNLTDRCRFTVSDNICIPLNRGNLSLDVTGNDVQLIFSLHHDDSGDDVVISSVSTGMFKVVGNMTRTVKIVKKNGEFKTRYEQNENVSPFDPFNIKTVVGKITNEQSYAKSGKELTTTDHLSFHTISDDIIPVNTTTSIKLSGSGFTEPSVIVLPVNATVTIQMENCYIIPTTYTKDTICIDLKLTIIGQHLVYITSGGCLTVHKTINVVSTAEYQNYQITKQHQVVNTNYSHQFMDDNATQSFPFIENNDDLYQDYQVNIITL